MLLALQVGLHSASLHHSPDVRFAILTDSFRLESSVVAKSLSSSEKGEQDVAAPPCGNTCCTARVRRGRRP